MKRNNRFRTKKILTLILCLLMIISLAACGGGGGSSDGDTSSNSQSISKQLKGTYWVAYETEDPDGIRELPTDNGHWCDIFFNNDGTVRLRNVYCDSYIYQDEDLNLTMQEKSNTVYLYDRFSTEPKYDVVLSDDVLIINSRDLYGDSYSFTKGTMPTEIGELYHPAELKGTWQMVSYEVEGYEDVVAPGEFNTIEFDEYYGNGYIGLIGEGVTESYMTSAKSYRSQTDMELVAQIIDDNIDGNTCSEEQYGMGITVLNEPLYDSCENNSWCALLGEYSPLDDYGYPLYTEYYVTMLDQNTLMRQMYYSMDGAPMVSYQTYKRVLPDTSHWFIEEEELEYSAWQSVGFIDENGRFTEKIPGIDSLEIYLNEYGICDVMMVGDNDDYSEMLQCVWERNHGAGSIAIYMTVDDYYSYYYDTHDRLWLTGGVLANNYGETAGYKGTYEMYLYHNNGFIKMELLGGMGIMTPIVDDDAWIEGNAYVAPAESILVQYGEGSFDFSQLDSVDFETIGTATSPESFVLTGVWDNTLLTVTDEYENVIWEYTLNRGESIGIDMDTYESANWLLWISIGTEDYCYYMDSETFNSNTWTYFYI